MAWPAGGSGHGTNGGTLGSAVGEHVGVAALVGEITRLSREEPDDGSRSAERDRALSRWDDRDALARDLGLVVPAEIVAAASPGNSTMYSSGWSARSSTSPSTPSEKTTQQFWLRTYHDLVPASETSSGSSLSNSKYWGAKQAPVGRSLVWVPPSCERGSFLS